jgi:hypothetical protein
MVALMKFPEKQFLSQNMVLALPNTCKWSKINFILLVDKESFIDIRAVDH